MYIFIEKHSTVSNAIVQVRGGAILAPSKKQTVSKPNNSLQTVVGDKEEEKTLLGDHTLALQLWKASKD